MDAKIWSELIWVVKDIVAAVVDDGWNFSSVKRWIP
jgi:hypothetical protein